MDMDSIAILMENGNIKERSVNFSQEEVRILLALVAKYKHILMCKKTDMSSSKQKQQAWRDISKEFNAIGKTKPRTLKQLKYKFENMKRNAKKEMICTGRGRPPILPPAAEDSSDWVRSMMSVSMDGNEPVYDDDIVKTPESDSVSDNNASNFVAVKFEDEEISPPEKKTKLENEVTSDGHEMKDLQKQPELIDSSTSHSTQKRPMAPGLARKIMKKQIEKNNLIKQALREHKINVLKHLNELEMERIKLSIEHQKELHAQVLRHNEEKHKLELLKLELEIDILKARKQSF